MGGRLLQTHCLGWGEKLMTLPWQPTLMRRQQALHHTAVVQLVRDTFVSCEQTLLFCCKADISVKSSQIQNMKHRISVQTKLFFSRTHLLTEILLSLTSKVWTVTFNTHGDNLRCQFFLVDIERCLKEKAIKDQYQEIKIIIMDSKMYCRGSYLYYDLYKQNKYTLYNSLKDIWWKIN